MMCRSFSHEGEKGKFTLLNVPTLEAMNKITQLEQLGISDTPTLYDQTYGSSCIEYFPSTSLLMTKQRDSLEKTEKGLGVYR